MNTLHKILIVLIAVGCYFVHKLAALISKFKKSKLVWRDQVGNNDGIVHGKPKIKVL